MKIKILLLIGFAGSLLLSGCDVILSFYPLYTEKELVRDDRIIGKWKSQFEEDDNDYDTLVWNITFEDIRKGAPNKFTYVLTVKHNIYPLSPPQERENYIIAEPEIKELLDDLLKAKFELHIVKLRDNLYLDFFPDDVECLNIVLFCHLMKLHSFAKVEIGDKITIKWFDRDWLYYLISDNKTRIKHEYSDYNLLLTAKPKVLQRFFIKYGNDSDAIQEDNIQTLTRVGNEKSENSDE